MFRVYYADESTFDGPVERTPATSVICIVQEDQDHGRHIISGPEFGYYCWHEDAWYGHDYPGWLLCMTKPGWKKVLFGETIPTPKFRSIMKMAQNDTDFPLRSAKHKWEVTV